MCSDFSLRREGWGEKRKEICRKSENFNVLNFSKDVSVQRDFLGRSHPKRLPSECEFILNIMELGPGPSGDHSLGTDLQSFFCLSILGFKLFLNSHFQKNI